MEEMGLERGDYAQKYAKATELIKRLDEGEPVKAYLALRKLFSIVEHEPEVIVQMYTENRELFDQLVRRLETLSEGADHVLRAQVKELNSKIDEIVKTIEAPKRGEEKPQTKYEHIYLYLRDENPYTMYKGLRLLSTMLEREPKTFIELTVSDPTLVEAIKDELQELSLGREGTIKVEAKRLLSRIEEFTKPPPEEGEGGVERPAVPKMDDERLERIIETLTQRPAPTPVMYTPPPSQTSTIVERLLEGFVSARNLSILFIVEGVIFFLVTGLMYTANFNQSSVNSLATIAFYCLIIGVVFRVLEDYYGDEKLEEIYNKHTFEFNMAKLFLVINAIFFLFLAVIR